MQQRRRFLDKVLQFMGIQEEEVTEEAERSERTERHERHDRSSPDPQELARQQAASVAEQVRRGRLVSLPGANRAAGQIKVSVIRPRSYEEVQQIADHLKERQPVILSLEGVDKPLSRRIIDFMSGTTYALDGKVHRIGEEIFLFAPINVAIDAETTRSWQEEEIFP